VPAVPLKRTHFHSMGGAHSAKMLAGTSGNLPRGIKVAKGTEPTVGQRLCRRASPCLDATVNKKIIYSQTDCSPKPRALRISFNSPQSSGPSHLKLSRV
jgi:hypothetical protein